MPGLKKGKMTYSKQLTIINENEKKIFFFFINFSIFPICFFILIQDRYLRIIFYKIKKIYYIFL
jgi:hypothetical protein